MKLNNTKALFAMILPLLVVCAGCGDTAVTGVVKRADGTPLKSVNVVFDNGTTNVIGPTNDKGEFSLYQIKPGDGVPPGTYRGQVEVNVDGASTGMSDEAYQEYLSKTLGFSSKYLDFDTSGLTLTVEAGKPVPKMEIVLEP